MSDDEKLDILILEALSTAPPPNRCLPKKELKKRVKHPPSKKFNKALEDLKERNWVLIKDEKCCLRPISPGMPSVEKVKKIYSALGTGDKTRQELAEFVKCARSTVDKYCRKLKERKWLIDGTPRREKGERRFFSPLTGEVIHRGNYERIRLYDNWLRSIVKKYDIGDPRMKKELKTAISRILNKEDDPKVRDSIENFSNELLGRIGKAAKKSEILDFLGIKPFTPSVPTLRSAFR